MKLIKYNDGIVSFKLPANWKEEYYDDGNAAFYREDSDSGTLRLSVLSTELKEEYNESVKLSSDSGMYVEEGFPLEEDVKLTNEGGDDILVYSWEVIVPVDSKGRRIILFSYTIPAFKEGDPETSLELNFIRNTILEASYSKEGN
ncbi:hypothetical protein CLV62_10877 [Dysgonomonas alginatilytica]|uniref:Uncharacterized protein n=1 Tax=Dysgonomonas alginatilytica TaxID=1605892 RepID=A0A2V3PPN2_9BACT|nr:hypothetical protein [Dysgonomonas alginatilytica]PXV65079.1 hypothetical protein CLV62_10877 [Dysgonomonas alginatilytica]